MAGQSRVYYDAFASLKIGDSFIVLGPRHCAGVNQLCWRYGLRFGRWFSYRANGADYTITRVSAPKPLKMLTD